MIIAQIFWTVILALLGPYPSLGAKGSFSSPHPERQRLTDCGILKISGGTYVLDNDVSSAGTCFSVQSSNITLDLNGHIVTYGTNQPSIPSYGVLGVACWDPDFGVGNPCGGTSNALTVFGGTITQDPKAAPFSHGIRLGQGPSAGPIVHDVTFNIRSSSSIPIFLSYVGTGAMISNNTINNYVTQVINRHQLHGMSIKFANSKPVPGPGAIFGNHIVGGAQGGIFSAAAGAKIYHNVVEQNGRYTNDFGVYAWSDGGEVYDNIISPASGRGIQIASSNSERVHDNKIIVTEKRFNEEYGGCQTGGTYGIQFDDDPKNAVAFGNDVVAKAEECGAQALRVTESLLGSGNVSHDNSYVARRVGNSSAFATGFGSGGATGFSSERDKFVGDSSSVRFDWDGGSNLTFRNCVFGRGENPATDYKTFSFKNGGTVPVKNIHFIDSIFEGGAAKDSTDMKPIYSVADWPGPAEYFVDWSLELTVENQDRKSVNGAAIEIRNAFGRKVFQGVSDVDGKLSTVLTELKVYNTASEVKLETDSPFSLGVQKAGCKTIDDLKFPILRPSKEKIVMSCVALPPSKSSLNN
jgi:hypothetical protein